LAINFEGKSGTIKDKREARIDDTEGRIERLVCMPKTDHRSSLKLNPENMSSPYSSA
jgi:hypothetical protein